MLEAHCCAFFRNWVALGLIGLVGEGGGPVV